MDLSSILNPAIIDLSVEGTTKDEVLRNLAQVLLRNGYIDDVEQFVSDIYEREAEGPTGMGEGISIPHGKSTAAKKIGIAIGRTLNPIRWESSMEDDGWQESTLVFLFCVFVDTEFAANHLMLLSQLAGKLGNEARLARLHQCQTPDEIIAAIPDKADVYAAALTWRPEMKVSELAIAQSDVAVKSARAGRMPQINLTGGLGDSHITGGRSNFFSQMKTNFNANVGVSVSIPILDNRQNKSAIERAQVQQLTSQLDMADARKALYTTIEDYWLGTTNSQAKYIAAKDNCASAQASYDMVQEQFRLGVKNIADLIAARAELLSANQNMIQDKYTALLNRTMLNFYSNGTITL